MWAKPLNSYGLVLRSLYELFEVVVAWLSMEGQKALRLH